MPISLTERFALFALDNKQHILTEAADMRLELGLCTALVQDLVQRGVLVVEGGKIRRSGKKAVIKEPYLQEAMAVFSSDEPTDLQTMLIALREHIPGIKAIVIGKMLKKGVVKNTIPPVHTAFAVKSYQLKPGKSGYRNRLFKALASQKLAISDYWVLRLAQNADLLGGGRQSKKAIQNATQRLSALAGKIAQGEDLVGSLSILIESREGSKKVSSPAKKAAAGSIWEWRGFWPDTGKALLQAGDLYRDSLENMNFSEMKDDYLLIEGMEENVKLRARALEIKRPLRAENGYIEFAPKESFRFPLSKKSALTVFPKISKENKIKNIKDLQVALRGKGMKSLRVKTSKKRLQAKLKNQIRIEFCQLVIGGAKFLSVCVEGPDFELVQSHAENFRASDVKVMGYAQFLKHHAWSGK